VTAYRHKLHIDHSQAPIDYELKVSARAKRITLRVVPGRGLVVSVPSNFSKAGLAQFLESQRQWIQSTLAAQEACVPERYRHWPPRELVLPAINTRLLLTYSDAAQLLPLSESGEEIVRCNIQAPLNNKAVVAREISVQLKKLAKRSLPGLLASHAHLHGLSYKRVSIRGQRTVWGSYSSSGTLSLNYKLLFLSRELLDYVLLHELAHTIHADHSPAFWQLLCSLNVNARRLDKQLRNASIDLPPWLEASAS